MPSFIEECRSAFAKCASNSKSERAYWKLEPPRWMPDDDPLRAIYADQHLLFDRPAVVWGAVVQANTRCYAPDSDDSPAAIVYSADPSFDEAPEALNSIARQLKQLKGGAPDDPELKAFADLLADEMRREMRTPLPSSLTGDRAVFYTTIVVARKHLPDGVLSQRFFPLLTNPERTPVTTILPSKYWGPELLDFWTDY